MTQGNSFSKRQYFDELNIARGIGALIVLFGHSFPDAEIGVFAHPIYRWLYNTCCSFHMALFFGISGCVMGRRFYSGDYKIGDEMIKKIKRLMIPYLFLSYISLLPKICLNSYARNPADGISVFRILLGKSPNGSLWYVYTLFVFSGIGLCIGKMLHNRKPTEKSIVIVLAGIAGYGGVIAVGEGFLENIFLDNLCVYFVFYALGILLYYYVLRRQKVFSVIAGALCLLVTFTMNCPYTSLKRIYFVTAILGSYGVLAIAMKISRQKETVVYRFLEECGKYSYDIYIISYYFQQPIRVICFRGLHWDYSVVFLMELVIGLAGSYMVSKYIVRKNDQLKRLIVGIWEEKVKKV